MTDMEIEQAYEAREMELHDKIEESLRKYNAVRGAWIGFNRGLYKHAPGSEMEKQCMNETARLQWVQAYSVFLGSEDIGDDVDGLTAMGDILLILANLTHCNFRTPFRDVRAFCK